MTLRIEDILATPGLDGLSLRGGAEGCANAIRWVHVSELEDPTPWLKGGELLLTTGMGVGTTPRRQRSYVERLAAAGLSGLGFGTGFSFTRVPKAVRTAGDELGFPVLEVPYEVPFIAITEAVFSWLAGEQVETFQRSQETQNALTREVLEGHGMDGIVRVLASSVGGWAMVLDLHGHALAVSPGSARDRASRLWDELRASRSEGAGFSLSVADRGDHVAVQPIGPRGRVEAFLAVGKKESLTQLDRLAAGHALSLLAIELDKLRVVADAERRLRGDFLDALVRGEMTAHESVGGLRRFGFDEGADVAVAALRAPMPVDEMAWGAEDVLSRRGGGFLTAPRDDDLFLLVQPDAEGWPRRLQEDLTTRLGVPVTVGAGSTVHPGQAARSLREATYALQVCRIEGLPVADFRALGTYRLLLTLQEPDALRAFADSVLGPLDRYDEDHQGELIRSLRAFLDRNSRWEAAAADLYVHRHTLRYRMRKVEELTERDLRSAHDRMEFWLALRARDLVRAPSP